MVDVPSKSDRAAFIDQVKNKVRTELAQEAQETLDSTLGKLRNTDRWLRVDEKIAQEISGNRRWAEVKEAYVIHLDRDEKLAVGNMLADSIKSGKVKPAFHLDSAFQGPSIPLETMMVGKDMLMLTKEQMAALDIPTENIKAGSATAVKLLGHIATMATTEDPRKVHPADRGKKLDIKDRPGLRMTLNTRGDAERVLDNIVDALIKPRGSVGPIMKSGDFTVTLDPISPTSYQLELHINNESGLNIKALNAFEKEQGKASLSLSA